MQTKLPFFPPNTKLINDSVGFRQQDGTVYYFHSGRPIYCHLNDDRNAYRFAMGNLVVNQLCTVSELSSALGEKKKNIQRYAKALRDHGTGYFFERKETRGQCHKMTPEKLSAIQADLDRGTSIYRAALNHQISESAISYHIDKGNLKKKVLP